MASHSHHHGSVLVHPQLSPVIFDGKERVSRENLEGGLVYPAGALLVFEEDGFTLATPSHLELNASEEEITPVRYFAINISFVDLTNAKTLERAVLVAGTVREEQLILPAGVTSLDAPLVHNMSLRTILASQGLFSSRAHAKIFDASQGEH